MGQDLPWPPIYDPPLRNFKVNKIFQCFQASNPTSLQDSGGGHSVTSGSIRSLSSKYRAPPPGRDDPTVGPPGTSAATADAGLVDDRVRAAAMEDDASGRPMSEDR